MTKTDDLDNSFNNLMLAALQELHARMYDGKFAHPNTPALLQSFTVDDVRDMCSVLGKGRQFFEAVAAAMVGEDEPNEPAYTPLHGAPGGLNVTATVMTNDEGKAAVHLLRVEVHPLPHEMYPYLVDLAQAMRDTVQARLTELKIVADVAPINMLKEREGGLPN